MMTSPTYFTVLDRCPRASAIVAERFGMLPGVRRRDDSVTSYKNARSAKLRMGRTRSKSSKRYLSSSGSWTVGSSLPVVVYRPCPLRFRSPSRTSPRECKGYGRAAGLGQFSPLRSRAPKRSRPARVTYSYTRWMTDLISPARGGSWPVVNNALLTVGRVASSQAGAE